MRRAIQADLAAIRACLAQRPELTMFPMSNLARFGFEGAAEYAPFFWVSKDNGHVTDVLTITRAGMVLPFLPSSDIEAAARVIRGRTIIGVIGPAPQARPLVAALGIGDVACTLNRDERHFALDLRDLVLPPGEGRLVPLQDLDLATFVAWRTAYHEEVLGDRPDVAAEAARAEIGAYAAADTHRALVIEGRPVAMTGFNAELPTIVQVGAVYTPPALRNRGYARRAVALHLAEARGRGVTRATLFSANDAAARAYAALGFRRIGDWTLTLCREPVNG